MRIAYFTNQYPKTSHSFIRREILALEKQGCDIFRFSLRGWDEALVDEDDIREQKETRYILKNGTPVLFLYGIKNFLSSPLRFTKALILAIKLGLQSSKPVPYYLIYLLESCVLLAWMQKAECNHVHVHFGTNPAQVAMFAHFLGDIEYSFTVHGPEEFDDPRGYHLQEKIRNSKFVVAVSSFGRSQLYRRALHEDWTKVKVIRCGIEKNFYQDQSGQIECENEFVCVGRLCEQKGQLLLVDAIATLVEEGLDIKLVLAGDGEMRKEIEDLIKQRKMQNNIHVTGWLSSSQVRAMIEKCRALVLPSFAEGLPVVIMEAMSLKRPVISTYIAGIPELVENNENGWLVPAGSVSELAIAIRKCRSLPLNSIYEMGEKGYKKVTELHDANTEANKIRNCINES